MDNLDNRNQGNDQNDDPFERPAVKGNESHYFDYGSPKVEENFYGEAPAEQGNALAIASLVCGILGICCCGFPTAVAAIICALIDRHNRRHFSGMALAGFICGIVSLVTSLFSLVFSFVMMPEFEAIFEEAMLEELLFLPRPF